MSDTQTFLDTLATRSQQRAGEPTWIAARRQAGAARFEAMGRTPSSLRPRRLPSRCPWMLTG